MYVSTHQARAGLVTFVLALTTFVALPVRAQRAPLVPFHTAYTYWDHHWIQWLPTHPRYESIEASIASSANDPSRQYIRVWLTERTPPKRQTYFFNDEAIARSMRGSSHFRSIRYDISGGRGKPSALDLSFTDDAGRDVAWRMRFDPEQRLTAEWAGLRPSGGHAANAVFILWVIGPNATTWDSELRIAGETFGIDRKAVDNPRPYGAAYARGVHGGIFNYGTAEIRYDADSVSSGWAGGRSFRRSEEGSNSWISQPFGYLGTNRLELIGNAADGLSAYRHRYGAHHMTVKFDPALPAEPEAEFVGRFEIAFDAASPLLHGRVQRAAIAGRIGLIWLFEQPDWARAAPIRSDIRRKADGQYELTVSSARQVGTLPKH